MAWQPLLMALLLAVLGVWALWAGIAGSSAELRPRARRDSERGVSFERMLYALSPGAHEAGTRIMLVLGGLAFIGGAVWCIKLAVTFTP